MASHFGEVIHPSSRAFWIDEDEEDLRIDDLDFTVNWTKPKPSSLKTFVVIESDIPTAFTKERIIRESEEVCTINHGPRHEPSIIYKVNDELYVCNTSPDVDIKHSSKFIDMIADILLKTEWIIGLTATHISHFKDVCKFDTPFLKSLSTKKVEQGKGSAKSGFLAQPNIVSGIVAGVLSYAEVMDLAATLYVLYTDSFALDSQSAMPLLELFENVLKCTVHKPTANENQFFNKGNLYMYLVIFIYLVRYLGFVNVNGTLLLNLVKRTLGLYANHREFCSLSITVNSTYGKFYRHRLKLFLNLYNTANNISYD